jgi:F-type H+-transporting ATPase subunit gamma
MLIAAVLLLLLCFPFAETFSLGATPTTREAQAIADEVFADFVSAEVDKVELVYTKFVSLINSTPTIQVGPWTHAPAVCCVSAES